MGRALKPANARFAMLPRRCSGCVYAAELSNGLVKVGFTENPRNRMTMLAREVAGSFGADLARFHVGADITRRGAIAAEQTLIQRLGEVADVVPGRREFFSGVAFGVAVDLVERAGS